jgi:hypothetical protein
VAVGTYANPWYANTGQDPTFYNHACCTQSTSKFGDGCLSFDGTDDYITLADSDDWYFGTGDFTIDCWVKFNTLPSGGGSGQYSPILSQTQDSTNKWHLSLRDDSGDLYWRFHWVKTATISDIFSSVRTLSTGTWYHITVVRNGSNKYIFENGVDVTDGGSTVGTTGNLSSDLYVGRYNSISASDYYLDGWIDELRISKGIARWTSDFDVATSAYPINYETNSILISDALDGDTDGEYILESRIVAGSNSASNAYGVRINSDTGAYNYPRQALSGNNSSIAAGRTYYTQSMYVCANGMSSGKVSYNRLLICPKSGNGDIRTGFSEQSNVISGTTVAEVRLEGAGYLNAFGTAANISTLTAVGNGGGIGYGSRFILWKKEYHS